MWFHPARGVPKVLGKTGRAGIGKSRPVSLLTMMSADGSGAVGLCRTTEALFDLSVHPFALRSLDYDTPGGRVTEITDTNCYNAVRLVKTVLGVV